MAAGVLSKNSPLVPGLRAGLERVYLISHSLCIRANSLPRAKTSRIYFIQIVINIIYPRTERFALVGLVTYLGDWFGGVAKHNDSQLIRRVLYEK